MIHFSGKKKKKKSYYFFLNLWRIFFWIKILGLQFSFFSTLILFHCFGLACFSWEVCEHYLCSTVYTQWGLFSGFFPIFILFFSNLIMRFLVWMFVFCGSIFFCFSLIQKVFSKYFSIYIYIYIFFSLWIPSYLQNIKL